MNKTWKYIYECVRMVSTPPSKKTVLHYISHCLPFVSQSWPHCSKSVF